MEKAHLAKEYVKFNERCMIRLLGDMRSYNYVVVPIHDFDKVCLLYTSPSPRDLSTSRMPSSA